jgi:hypothetical protein
VVFGVVLFLLLALGLFAMGRWGTRSATRVVAGASMDKLSVQHRQGVVRRGAYACYAGGVLFLLVAGVLMFSRQLDCPRVPGQCSNECALAHQCDVPPHPASPAQR